MIFLYEILNDPINQNLNDKQGAQLDVECEGLHLPYG